MWLELLRILVRYYTYAMLILAAVSGHLVHIVVVAVKLWFSFLENEHIYWMLTRFTCLLATQLISRKS